ncbi:MAG: hypothetical protein H6707_13415 [Deltaproteobacteria bacterium]|nr:hypothetical protein [Deltaproteobacteria bacterium]
MLRRIVDIRAGEAARLALSFVILMLVVGSYTVVKAVRDSVFLKDYGVTELSFIAIGMALLTGFVVTLYLRTTGGIARNVLISATNTVIAASLVVVWLLLGAERPAKWVPWALYVWSSIFGVFTVSQFWLLANDLFDPREAKRLFGFVGAGAILGGMLGGFSAGALAKLVDTRGLLLIAGGMLLLAAGLTNVVWPRRRVEGSLAGGSASRRAAAASDGGGFAVVRKHPYVRLIALALLLSTLATTLLDYQFKNIVKAHFAGRPNHEMTAFFGALFGYLSLASLALQTLGTGAILRRFGIAVGLLMLPVSLALGSMGLLFHQLLALTPLAAVSSAKVAEGGLRFAIDKASMELMWLPVPSRIKDKGKSFVDTVIDRFGTGLTGLCWLLLAVSGLTVPSRIHLVSIVVLSALGLWIIVLLGARRAYVDALRASLVSRAIDARLLSHGIDAAAQRVIAQALTSKDPREVTFALHLLRETPPAKLPDLAALLAHADSEVRCETLRLLSECGDQRYRAQAADCLSEPSVDVQRLAISYLQQTAPLGEDELLSRVAADDPRTAFACAVVALARPAATLEAADRIRRSCARSSRSPASS